MMPYDNFTLKDNNENTCEESMYLLYKRSKSLFPISFSIPEEKIVDSVPEKHKMISSLFPGDRSTYVYNTEKEYYDEYKKSIFAYTFKKGGWDCMRHYEILACGCIPFFPNIDKCPNNILSFLPKKLMLKGNELFEIYKDRDIGSLNDEDKNILYGHIRKLIEHSKKYITTKNLSDYLIKTLNENANVNNIQKILVISADPWSEYLRCTILHGLKKKYGKNCHDYPKIRHLYKDEDIDYLNYCYGKGYSYSNLIDQSFRDNSLDDSIEEDIKNRKYDIIIWPDFYRWYLGCTSRPHFEHYELAQKYYPANRLVFLNGWDRADDFYGDYMSFVERGNIVFMREYLG